MFTPPLKLKLDYIPECYRKKMISSEVSKCILQSTPLSMYPILCLKSKLVNFNLKWIFENLKF